MATTPRKAKPDTRGPAADSITVDDVPPAAEPTPDVPVPTAIKAMWFPATVTLPGQPARAKAKVYAAVEGLYVYYTVPADGQYAPPEFFSPIDYSQAVKPPTGFVARNGFVIPTDAGLIGITLDRGCGCGWPLKRWTPEFARRIVRW